MHIREFIRKLVFNDYADVPDSIDFGTIPVKANIDEPTLLPGGVFQGIREVSEVQNYPLESRRRTKGGEVFYYAKAGAECRPGFGAKFMGTLKFDGGIAIELEGGEVEVTIRNDGIPFEQNELVGGFLLIHHATNMQNRRIKGNTPNTGATVGAIASAVEGDPGEGYFTIAANVAATFKEGDKIVVYGSTGNDGFYTVAEDAVYTSSTKIIVEEAVEDDTVDGNITGAVTLFLEDPITDEFAVASFVEILPNAYADLRFEANERVSHAGIPATKALTGEYFWVQSHGPCWVTPGGGSPSGVGDDVNERTVVFVGDGSVNAVSDITLESGYQVAGFIIQNDSSEAAGPPLVMLQIRP